MQDPAVHSMRWIPDTCRCRIAEYHNARTDEWAGTAQGEGYGKCPAHAHVPDDQIYQTLRTENANKNVTHGRVIEHGGSKMEEVEVWPEGHKRFTVDAPDNPPFTGKAYQWEYAPVDPTKFVRKLKVTLHGFSDQHKKLIQQETHKQVVPDHVDFL